MKRQIVQTWPVILLLFTSACGGVTPVPTITPVPSPSSSPAPTDLPVTPTATIQAACPSVGKPAKISVTKDQNDSAIKNTILGYLNDGGNPTAQDVTLLVNAPPEMKFQLAFIPIDLDGDGVNEQVAKIYHALDDWPSRSAFITIFRCVSGSYRSVGSFGADEILAIEDLTGDGHPELLLHSNWFGSGCLEFYSVIGWGDFQSSAVDYLDGSGNVFPCDTTVEIKDTNIDRPKELVFRGSERFRNSEVPGRDFIFIYKVREVQAYERVSQIYLSEPSLVYILVDAQAALDENPYGPYHQAISLYKKVIADTTLPVQSPELDKESHSREYVIAFALFRLVTIYSGSNFFSDEAKVTEYQELLEQKFLAGQPGYEFVKLAKIFVEQMKAGKKPQTACNAVAQYVEKEYPKIEEKFQWGWLAGYNNHTLCPY